jgi:hypothetical protein
MAVKRMLRLVGVKKEDFEVKVGKDDWGVSWASTAVHRPSLYAPGSSPSIAAKDIVNEKHSSAEGQLGRVKAQRDATRVLARHRASSVMVLGRNTPLASPCSTRLEGAQQLLASLASQ